MTRHTKRVASPVFWRAGRKNFRWITSPAPGPHSAARSIPLQVLLRDVLKLAHTGREARAIIREGKVLVDGTVRKDHKFPVGLMDVVSLPDLQKHYRAVPHESGLSIIEIPAGEASLKPVRVESKQAVRGGNVQATAHDGQNFLGLKASVGDTLLLKGGKVDKQFKMKPGALCLVVRGKQAGRMGHLVEGDGSPGKKGLARLKGNRKGFDAPFSYIMVIGDKKPVVKVYEEAAD
jgi:small subunit ribosomal protein S4e